MADFNLYYPKLVKHEGGYANDPKDTGGETYRGIARRYNPTWNGWVDIDAKKKAGPIKWNSVFPELESKVKPFYKKAYWDSIALDKLNNQSIAEFLADFKINGMWKSDVNKIQSFVGAVPDGAIGRDTIEVINKYPDTGKLHDFIFKTRKEHYDRVVAVDPSQSKFYDGWTNRIKQFSYDNKGIVVAAGVGFFFWILLGVVAFIIYKKNK